MKKTINISFNFIIIYSLCFVLSTSCFAQQAIENLLVKIDSTKNNQDKFILSKQIASYYQDQKAHLKAIEYFEKAEQLLPNIDKSQKQEIKKQIAYSFSQLGKYTEAIQMLETMLKEKDTNQETQLTLYNQLTYLTKQNNDLEQAIKYAKERIALLEQTKNNLEITEAYNNLGVIYQEQGNTTEAVNTLQKAISLGLALEQNTNKPEEKAILDLNLGTTFANLRDFQTARFHFFKSLAFWEKQKNAHKIAQTRNYLAANYYVSGNNSEAINYAQQAADLAQLNNDEEVLLVSYQILTMAHQLEGEIAQTQYYQNLSNQLGEKLRERKRKAEQEQAARQLEIEKKENEIKNLISDKEKQAMSLAQVELERQKQEKELALLKREQELQQSQLKAQELEKESIRQLLEITRQKAIADQQKIEVERQKLLAENEKIEREKNEVQNAQKLLEEKTARESLENQKKQQEKQLEQEQKMRYFGFGVIGLIGITLVIMIISFINARKTARRLKKQNTIIEEQSAEILSQNEELFQNQEEILAQRDFIGEKNKELETRNRFINKSMNAALSIQQAILPYKQKLDNLLNDYFIIYRPKDVVSGDFYWLNKINDKIILVVADCTGHGVQGAFMTLIGNTLLDKIVRVWDIIDPKQILNRLHEEIFNALRQEDTKNDDGMDLVVICLEVIEQNQTKITFAGAKNSLYYIDSNSPSSIQILRGTRKSVGGKQNQSRNFENQEIILPQNSLIYVGSDGLQDQNNFNRERFGERRIIKTLEENAHLPVVEQKIAIENTLDEYSMQTEQRDDILWLGVRL
jgi:serine phosphatase RsbU (regulator of sigma subunit)/tetratricopeptide (TPR) repeat protein